MLASCFAWLFILILTPPIPTLRQEPGKKTRKELLHSVATRTFIETSQIHAANKSLPVFLCFHYYKISSPKSTERLVLSALTLVCIFYFSLNCLNPRP